MILLSTPNLLFSQYYTLFSSQEKSGIWLSPEPPRYNFRIAAGSEIVRGAALPVQTPKPNNQSVVASHSQSKFFECS